MYMVCLAPGWRICSYRCTGAFASASLVPYCSVSIAFVGGVLDRSVDLPLVRAESPNLDLEPDRSRCEFGGGGGKFMALSLRPMADMGVPTAVMALAGVETSATRWEVARTLPVWRCSGGDLAFNCWLRFGALLGV